MELAVILVLTVIVELALTFYLLGRLRDFRRSINDLVDRMANLEHGIDGALADIDVCLKHLGNAQTHIGRAISAYEDVPNGKDDNTSMLASAAQAAASASPDEVAQAKAVLESLGIKMD